MNSLHKFKKHIPLSILSLLLIMSPEIYAASELGTDASITARAELLNAITLGIKIFSYFLGLLLMIKGGYLLKDIADQKVKFGFGSVAVVFITATLIFSYTSSLSMIIPVLLGEQYGYCYSNNDGDYAVSSGYDRNSNSGGVSSQFLKAGGVCFNPESSEVTSAMHTKILSMSSQSTADSFVKNLRNIISLFQIIGSIYFIKGTYGLYENATGNAREPGYGKPIVTMIASSFLVDLGHTLEMLLATLRAIGMNF